MTSRMIGSGDIGAINVKNAPYLAKGDTRKVFDAVLNRTTTVTSATANFTTADIGKVIFAPEYVTGTLYLPVCTIAAVNSATSITTSLAATGTLSNVPLVFGTDDTAAIQAAGVAAKAMVPSGKVILPAGGYLFSALLFDLSYAAGTDTITVQGDGSNCTFLYPHPNFDFSTTAANQSMVFKMANASWLRASGFTLDCHKFHYGFNSTTSYPLHVNSASAVVSDVRVLRTSGSYAAMYVGQRARLYNVHQEDAAYVGLYMSAVSVEAFGCYCGNNGNFSLLASNINGLSNTQYFLRWIGGTVDESGAGGASLVASTDVDFIGAKLYGPTGPQFAATVDGTSIARFINSEIVPFGTGNRSGLKVLSGGITHLCQTRVAGSGTGVAYNNAGTIYDNYGNTITGVRTGAAPLAGVAA